MDNDVKEKLVKKIKSQRLEIERLRKENQKLKPIDDEVAYIGFTTNGKRLYIDYRLKETEEGLGLLAGLIYGVCATDVFYPDFIEHLLSTKSTVYSRDTVKSIISRLAEIELSIADIEEPYVMDVENIQ